MKSATSEETERSLRHDVVGKPAIPCRDGGLILHTKYYCVSVSENCRKKWSVATSKCPTTYNNIRTCDLMTEFHGTGEILAALGLRTLGRSLRERGVRGEGARMALTAVARLLDALLLTR